MRVLHVCSCLCVVYYTVYGVTSRGTAVSLLQGNDGRGLHLSLLTRRASVCEEKTRGFDVKLRERPVSLCLSLFRKVRVCITPSILLTVRKNKPEQFIRLSHYFSPPAWLGWVRVHDWNILQVFFSFETHHNGLPVSSSRMCRPWTARWFCFIGGSTPYHFKFWKIQY